MKFVTGMLLSVNLQPDSKFLQLIIVKELWVVT